MSAFTSRPFLLAAAFLWGCGSSQLTLLAVVLGHHGMAPPAIAATASSMTVATMLAALASGTLASRFGALRTLKLGGAIAVFGITLLPLALDSAPFTTLANMLRGAGFGLLTPSGQMLAQTLVDESDRTRAVAVFTAMFLVPAFFAPASGEWALAHLGEGGFFLLVFLPTAAAVGAVTMLPRTETPAPPNVSGYLTMLRDRRLWVPNLATAGSGASYAFAWTFLPLMLIGSVPIAFFFAPFAVTLLATRFIGMKYLQQLPPPAVIAFGLLAYASGSYQLTTLALVPLCGVLFGFGYGVTMPSAIEWSTRLYPQNRRPVALVNFSFQVGSIVAVQTTGAALTVLGWAGVLTVLGTLIMAVLVIVAGSAILSRLRPACLSVRRTIAAQRPPHTKCPESGDPSVKCSPRRSRRRLAQ